MFSTEGIWCLLHFCSESQPQIFETQQTKRVLDSEASTGCVPYAELFGVTESAPLCVKL